MPDFPVVILFGLALHNTPLHDPVLESIKADLRVLLARSAEDVRFPSALYRNFKPPFFLARAISPDRRDVNLFLFDENPDVASAGSGGAAVGRRAKVFLFTPLARTQSERRRRLALASGFRLSDCLE